MKNNEKLALLFGGLSAVIAIKTCRDAVKETKRIEKQTEDIRNFQSILAAYSIVRERIVNGEYDGKTKEDIKTDFEFEKIAYLEK